jgi:hypothetical protein
VGSIESISLLREREMQYLEEDLAEERIFEEQHAEIVEDWRQDSNFFSAFFKRRLMRTDYYVMLSILAVTLLLVGYGVTVFYQNSSSTTKLIGFNVGLAALLLVLSVRPLHRNYLTLADMDVFDWVSLVAGVLVYFGLGLAYYFVYRAEDPNMKYYLIYLMGLLVPLFLGYGLVKLDDQNYQVALLPAVLIALGFAFALSDSIYMIVVVSVPAGVAVLCATAYGMAALGVYFYYRRNDSQLPDKLKLGLLIANAVAVLVLIIIAFTVDSVNNFWVFTVAFLLAGFGLLGYSLYRLVTEEYISEFFLMFYSSDWSRIYSYERQKSEPVSQFLSQYGLSLGLFLLQYWTFIAMIFQSPIHLGISLSTVAELVAFQLLLFLLTRTEIESHLINAKTEVALRQKVQVEAWDKVRKALAMANIKKYEDLKLELEQVPA